MKKKILSVIMALPMLLVSAGQSFADGHGKAALTQSLSTSKPLLTPESLVAPNGQAPSTLKYPIVLDVPQPLPPCLRWTCKPPAK
jgi:hypothetical protein